MDMNEQIIREVMSEMGRRSRAKMSPAQRVTSARSAANARWDAKRASVQKLDKAESEQDTDASRSHSETSDVK